MAELRNWPPSEERNELRYDILPFIDWMRLTYVPGVEEGRPVLRLALEWQPEGEAVYMGRRTSMSDVPGSVHLVGIDLRAGVYVGGEKAAELVVVVDSMMSGPHPDLVEISLPDLAWDNVFSDTPAVEARDIFDRGFELRNLEIASAAFAVIQHDEEGADASSRRSRTRRHENDGPTPTSVSVYRGARAVDVVFDLFWLIGPRPYRWVRVSGEPRKAIGRGSSETRSRSGRSSSGRSSDDQDQTAENGESTSDRNVDRREGKRKASGIRIPESSGDKDDDDDDDDSKLVPYAIAAVAAAGILAAAGGTVGYYGSSRHAPFGVTSGIVRRDGGLLLQVGVNEALIFNEPQPKKLVVKLLSFGNLLRSDAIQPALGGGVLATSEGGQIKYEPSISFGGVGRYKMLLFYGGYDFWQQGPEFGAAFNFRELFKRPGESPRP